MTPTRRVFLFIDNSQSESVAFDFVDDGIEDFGPSSFEYDVENGMFDVVIVEGSFVGDFEYIAVMFADDGGDAGKSSGDVANIDGEVANNFLTDEGSCKDGREYSFIDIGATNDESDIFVGEFFGLRSHGGKGSGTGSFCDDSPLLEEVAHALFDLGFVE